MLLRVSQRVALAVWRNPIVRRFMMQQVRRMVMAVVLTRAAELVAARDETRPEESERVIIPIREE